MQDYETAARLGLPSDGSSLMRSSSSLWAQMVVWSFNQASSILWLWRYKQCSLSSFSESTHQTPSMLLTRHTDHCLELAEQDLSDTKKQLAC